MAGVNNKKLSIFAAVALAFALLIGQAAREPGHAQDFTSQDWLLNPKLSNVYMQTVKANAVFETHQFAAVEGNVGKEGDVSIRIDLASLETGIDVRDVRMRFLMFETFKYPHALITAKLDKDKVRAISSETRIAYPLAFTLDMHGVKQEMKAQVWITRIGDTTVSVSTIQPIVVTTDSVGLSKNLAKLIEVIGGTPIASAASITFDLVFGSGSLAPQLASARAQREKQRADEAGAAITSEACETRFTVISRTGAIYFKTGSADLDSTSDPLLASVVDFAKRCPSVKLDVEGHTDNVGNKSANQRLSELRAKTIVDYLSAKGVAAARLFAAGYGDSRPVAGNDTEPHRAENRRIEFRVKKE